jgi:hypothetical protein
MAMLLLGLAAPVAAQQIPALAAASDPGLVARREALMQERAMLHSKIDSLNARCGAVEEGSAVAVSCENDQVVLLSALAAHIRQSNDYNAAAQALITLPIVANLANDPNAARLSAAQIKLVDGRIANLQKAIALLGGSNPEWARERQRVLDDMHEDAVALSQEGVNLMTIGLTDLAKLAAESHVSNMYHDALVKAFKEPLKDLPSEEARLNRILVTTQDPDLTKAILEYKDALHRLREAQYSNDVVKMVARTREAAEILKSEFAMLTLKPRSIDIGDGLYQSSAFLGLVAIVFTVGPEAIATTVGSAGSSIVLGGRQSVNLWQERAQLKALDQNTSNRNRMKVELTERLYELEQQHERLVWAVQHAGPTARPQ